MKSNHAYRPAALSAAVITIAAIGMAGNIASAATIIWNGTTVTHMANDGVAANNYAQLIPGTYQEAGYYNATSAVNDGSGILTFNDGARSLAFNPIVATTIGGTGDFGADEPRTGDATFDTILTEGRNHGVQTITLGAVNALTVGTTYTLQIWAHSATGGVKFQGSEAVATTFTGQISGGGNPATLNSITDNPWFVTASFVATGTTQTVTMDSVQGGTGGSVGFDAYLVTVPEPSSVALLGIFGGLALLRRRRA